MQKKKTNEKTIVQIDKIILIRELIKTRKSWLKDQYSNAVKELRLELAQSDNNAGFLCQRVIDCEKEFADMTRLGGHIKELDDLEIEIGIALGEIPRQRQTRQIMRALDGLRWFDEE